MATIVCDICSGNLTMNVGGESATCSACGVSYSVERLREKIQDQNVKSGATVNNPQISKETLEDLEHLAKKYMKLSDWENAEKIYQKILEIAPKDENAFDMLNKLKVWKHMEVENGVLKKFSGKTNEIIFPESVTSIGPRVFTGNKGINTVIFNERIEHIDREAFYQNRDLKKVVGIKNVKFIGKGAFFDCYNMEECEIGDSVEYIGDEAFRGCSSLVSLNLPESLKQLERGAFKGCKSLEEMIVPENISVISASLFEQCYSLKRVDLPEGLKIIETNAFYGCKALKELNLPEEIEELQASCFKESGLTSFEIPKNLVEIPAQCFDRCEGLTSITIPKNIKRLCDKAFYGCVSLTSIYFDKGIGMGRNVFFNCRRLTYVNRPEIENGCTAVVAQSDIDLTSMGQDGVEVLPYEVFYVFKGTPYYDYEILRRRNGKLCERCAGKLGFFGKCKACGFKAVKEKR